MMKLPVRTRWPSALLLATLVLSACNLRPTPSAADVRADILRKLPSRIPDRQGWAGDLYEAFNTQGIEATPQHICAVLAVVEQESNYQVDPKVPGLGRIAREEIDRRAAAYHIPKLAVSAALLVKAPDGRSYADHLAEVTTEKQLSDVFERMISEVPLGSRLLGRLNPVHTAGPMQVSIAFAQAHARGYRNPSGASLRHEVFTRRGGLYFGVKHLLGYPVDYPQMQYRFADFNAGWYASRNAGFQNALAVATGRTLALDGDVIAPDAPMDAPGDTERALRTLSLGMTDQQLREALLQADTASFAGSGVYREVFTRGDARAKRTLPRALVPTIDLKSPKITRKLTTAWFADRVNQRYKSCLSR